MAAYDVKHQILPWRTNSQSPPISPPKLQQNGKGENASTRRPRKRENALRVLFTNGCRQGKRAAAAVSLVRALGAAPQFPSACVRTVYAPFCMLLWHAKRQNPKDG